MKKFIHQISKAVLAAITICFLALFSVANVSALVDTPWGPSRTTFTWENPAPYATFNSITNNPQLGDERNFVRIREVADGKKFGDEVTLEVGKTYEVYIYYHNNADGHEVGSTAIGIADGASVKSSFPATVKKGERATVTATIFASDTNPLAVWDGAYMNPTRDAYLRYVPGSAIIHNGGDLNGQSIGPDYLFGEGALLGYNKFSGILPGCNKYAGYITYQFFVDAPDFTVKKSVVGESSTFKIGDEVTFKIRYDNTGTMDQNNVVVKDTLPKGLSYVPGSTILYNNNYPNGKSVNDDIISQNGMNIGSYAGGKGWAEVVFKAKVTSDAKCGEEIVNSAVISTTDGNKTAKVTITIDECEPEKPEEPEEPEKPEEPEEPEKPEEPEEPEKPEEPEEPETPEEIVTTGPVEITLAVVIILGIIGGGYYYYRTSKTLKSVENKVSGGNQGGLSKS